MKQTSKRCVGSTLQAPQGSPRQSGRARAKKEDAWERGGAVASPQVHSAPPRRTGQPTQSLFNATRALASAPKRAPGEDDTWRAKKKGWECVCARLCARHLGIEKRRVQRSRSEELCAWWAVCARSMSEVEEQRSIFFAPATAAEVCMQREKGRSVRHSLTHSRAPERSHNTTGRNPNICT